MLWHTRWATRAVVADAALTGFPARGGARYTFCVLLLALLGPTFATVVAQFTLMDASVAQRAAPCFPFGRLRLI